MEYPTNLILLRPSRKSFDEVRLCSHIAAMHIAYVRLDLDFDVKSPPSTPHT
jgi:hypothetical protein